MLRRVTHLTIGSLLLLAGAPAGADTAVNGPKAEEQEGQPRIFIATPGHQEFSGQLIARPIQPAVWAQQGLAGEELIGKVQEARRLANALDIDQYIWQTDEYVINVGIGNEQRVADALLETGLFQYVHPNWIVYPLACPDDPRLGNQWHHNANRMNSCAGWDLHTGNPTTVVAYCDTGIRTTHEDLLLHRREAYNAVDQVWESQGGAIDDINGHGTNVTGCGSANGDNGVGIAGVGWNLGHRMMRVSNSGGGGSSLVALNHGARTAIEAGDKVASVSYSGVDNSTNLTTATYIKSLGGLLVWAAGNDNRNITFGDRDADDIIVAGGTNQNDNKASFSAYGRFVDVVAPAVDVYTTSRASNSSYSAVSGTSFACPLTAGLIGLIWSANPSLTPDEVEAILKAGCDDLGDPGVDNIFGYGRINVLGSLSLVSSLRFEFPNNLPTLVHPDGGTTVRVEVVGVGLDPAPGSGRLHVNTGGGWEIYTMDEVSANVYDAVFPPADCETDVAYYFSAVSSEGQTFTSPAGAPGNFHSALSAADIITVFYDNFDTDQGWVAGAPDDDATTGHWSRMPPQQTQNGGQIAQPGFVVDGTNCWVTDGRAGNSVGQYDVDNGKTTVFSPIFDLDGIDPIISYHRWYSNHVGANPFNDIFVVDVSNDGGVTWTNLEVVGPSGNEVQGGWLYAEFRLKNHIQPTSAVQFRFIASDYDPQALVEACVDAFKIEVVDCGVVACPADLNGDGRVDAEDFFIYLDWFAAGDARADLNGDGEIDAADFFIYLDLFAQGCD